MENNLDIEQLTSELKQAMMAQYGPLIGGENLSRVLGYRSLAAMRQAVKNKSIPVPIFTLEKRRGKFALTSEVAHWIAKERINAEC